MTSSLVQDDETTSQGRHTDPWVLPSGRLDTCLGGALEETGHTSNKFLDKIQTGSNSSAILTLKRSTMSCRSPRRTGSSSPPSPCCPMGTCCCCKHLNGSAGRRPGRCGWTSWPAARPRRRRRRWCPWRRGCTPSDACLQAGLWCCMQAVLTCLADSAHLLMVDGWMHTAWLSNCTTRWWGVLLLSMTTMKTTRMTSSSTTMQFMQATQ